MLNCPSKNDIAFSVVIPALNEAEAIRSLLERIDQALGGQKFEIIVVDDGSSDDTSTRLKGGPAHWRVLRHERAGGQSAALHSGILAARAPLIVTLDGDGQNPPEEIPVILETWARLKEDPKLGLVAGQRLGRNDSMSKRLASRAANAIRATALKDGTRDTGCGLKAIRRDVFLALPFFNHMHRYLPALVNRAGFTVAHVDVRHAAREVGQSKYSNLQRALVGAVDLIGVMWLIRRKKTVVPTEIQHAAVAELKD
jgi:dolichol-phosphate mannosyltransferase